MSGAIAAIDCGTNSTRLLIADSDGHEVARIAKVTRLGQGVDASRQLAPSAVHRTLDVLADFRRCLDRRGAVRGRLVATSAVRDARNGAEFLAAATTVTGLRAELLSGLEEGELAYAGATKGLDPQHFDFVVLDIGGGSTELIAKRSGRLHPVSLDVGSVRITERYFRNDPPLQSEVRSAMGLIRQELRRAQDELGPVPIPPAEACLIGLAGTVSTLASLEQGLSTYERTRIHHFELSRQTVEGWFETLSSETTSIRSLRASIARGREDVILGGILVLREVMALFGFESCLVSESDILDGLVMSQQ